MLRSSPSTAEAVVGAPEQARDGEQCSGYDEQAGRRGGDSGGGEQPEWDQQRQGAAPGARDDGQ
ncbi:hypothetical protein [Saccharopolyspora endophytica]|uniref:Uncharacterized protein n=1 Tax=Saccharopolyspora endophytica TaxID=543886 RepID=A0ABS5DHN5_9PSEU|nr:hypothetical protein [Saccharopolyspora endophytica]MBQ0925788.1 hypothetical protein [Saccharopolyspora endophytica]